MEAPLEIPSDALAAFRDVDLPPSFARLWLAGSLEGLHAPCVAVVGTRGASAYGRRLASEFARDLAHAGCTVLSGLALGIDAAAHRAAVEAGAMTIGVLGCGHRRFFPRSNLSLARAMIERGGAVVSPYEPERAAFPHQFLERNALVAALADAVVVIEAPARSGALNTAGWAAGRIPVFAVPGDVDRAGFAGSHALLRDGAILARRAADVVEVLQPTAPRANATALHERPDDDPLLAQIQGEVAIDALIERSHERAAEVLARIGLLELQGRLERREGNVIARRR